MEKEKIVNNSGKKIARSVRIGLSVIALTGLGLTGCGKPDETPQPTQEIIRIPSTPTIKSPEAESSFIFKHLSKGDLFFAKPGDIAKGDLEVNDSVLYDQSEDTGVITVLTNGGKVTAVNNGGDVIQPKPGADINKILAQLEQEMRSSNPQIKTVRIQVFLGETQAQAEREIQGEDRGVFVDFVPGKTKVVSSAVLSGDFRLNGINGIKMHDNRGDTGAILMIEGQAAIFSEFGGSGSANFRTQAGLEVKTREILLQKLTEFREVTVNEIDRNGNLISSITYTREGLLIDNLADIRPDRIALLNGQIIFQDNAGINFDNRREDRREDRRQDRRNP